MTEYVLKQRGDTDPEALARAAVRPGMTLYGFCCGHFGRDSYGDKQVIAVGEDYVTVSENGAINTSRKIGSWVELLRSSNSELEEHPWED